MYFMPVSGSQDKVLYRCSVEKKAAEYPENIITLLKRTLIFENSVYKAYSDHISDISGHEVNDYLSIEPKAISVSSITGVAVLPVYNTKIGLIKVFRHPLGKWSWEAVKGHIEVEEEICFSAIRELQEELGAEVGREDVFELGIVSPEAGMIKGRIKLFFANIFMGNLSDIKPELGHNEIMFFSWDEIQSLIFQGDIEDSATLCILFKYKDYLFQATHAL